MSRASHNPGSRSHILGAGREVPIPADGLVLLLHFEGPQGSSTFIDSSSRAHVFNPSGTAQISTQEFQFGTSSLFLNGATNDWLFGDGSSDFAFALGDFTIDCWAHTTDTGTASRYVWAWSTAGGAFTSGYGLFTQNGVWSLMTGTTTIAQGGTVTPDTWEHVAVTRAGGIVRLFVGGTQVGTDVSSPVNVTVPANGPVIGNRHPSVALGSWMGYIDEFRVLNGVAVWTADFTPPTTPYPPP